MSIGKYKTSKGTRYRVWIYSHGRVVATDTFDRKRDAENWEREKYRELRQDDWIDPRRGKIPLRDVADAWMRSRAGLKKTTRDTDEGNWRRHVEPEFGDRPIVSITEADVLDWMGEMASGRELAPTTITQALACLRGILKYAVADRRIRRNVAEGLKPSKRGRKRPARFLTDDDLHQLADAAGEAGRDVVLALGLTGLRWSELVALQAGDLTEVPGIGVRIERATTTGQDGKLVTDEVKNYQARTVPLVEELHVIAERLAEGKPRGELLFTSPTGRPLREGNWRRAIGWNKLIKRLDLAPLRIHDLRHTAASMWIAKGADVKVVQRILGHKSATMTLDLYGHLWDTSLWDAAKRFTHTSHTSETESQESDDDAEPGEGR